MVRTLPFPSRQEAITAFSDIVRALIETAPLSPGRICSRLSANSTLINERHDAASAAFDVGSLWPKSVRRVRIRNFSPGFPVEGGELSAATFPNGFGQLRAVVCEIIERGTTADFFTHEQHGDLRHQQQQRQGGPERLWLCEQRQALAKGAVSDLIMVLQEGDERGGRQVAARLSATALHAGLPTFRLDR